MGGLGIIGGADGPTAIFVSYSPDWGLIILLAVIAAVGVGAWLFLRRRKK